MSTDLSGLNELKGFIGACLVEVESGMMMASTGGGKLDLETAGALNAEVVKSKLQAIETLKLGATIEDILITLDTQYHLIRPLGKQASVFLYVALDRKEGNLALARVQVRNIEATLSI